MENIENNDEFPLWHERLRARLDDLGWSTAELARRMGHDDQAFRDRLYKYVRGAVKNPRGDMLEEIAKALGWQGAQLRYGAYLDDLEKNMSTVKSTTLTLDQRMDDFKLNRATRSSHENAALLAEINTEFDQLQAAMATGDKLYLAAKREQLQEALDLSIAIIGEAASGVWKDASSVLLSSDKNVSINVISRSPKSPFPADPRYPQDAQYDLTVRGSSIDRVARDGDLLRCVDLNTVNIEVANGDLVLVRRTRDNGQLVEISAKRVRRIGEMIELWPDSNDPQWQSPIGPLEQAEDPEIRIVAWIPYVYRPTKSGW